MKDAWPNKVESHGQGSDEALVLPVSVRAAKSIIRLSQALDEIAKGKGAKEIEPIGSMMQAYKFVSAYSGILNESAVQAKYNGDKYSAMDAVISTTKSQFEGQAGNIAAALEMIKKGRTDKKVLDLFKGRWGFMRDTIEGLSQKKQNENT